MRITPSDSWTWSYQSIGSDDYLGIHLTMDNGGRYFFRTNFKVQQLSVFPEYGEPFCVLDGQLLNDFMEGLSAIGVHDNSFDCNVSINMELALNAVACSRFVRAPKNPIGKVFLPYAGPKFTINRGRVVTLYSKDRKVCDFIVLDDENEVSDDIFRVMLINREFIIGSHALNVGGLIKVPRYVICPFRSQTVTKQNTTSSYA